ncbi:MAG: hypothetical protein DRP81_08080 [Candidatus Omnitrophota bacterium]|nr:MAG: hypothetical protein DRP81_08080 [Candidatus Omnitrophota bacterium]
MIPDLGDIKFTPDQEKFLSETKKHNTFSIDIEPKSSEIQQATPQRFTISTLLDDRLILQMPIEVEIERENETYIAKCGVFEEFGYGDDPMTSVIDLQQTLAELYWTLKEEQNRLGPYLIRIWNRLQEVIVER